MGEDVPIRVAWDEQDLRLLQSIRRRVLWLATYTIHYANEIRPNPDGTKVGGHQASSASVVSILTALYFKLLRAGDRVAIKPHASPVFHAIQALRGKLSFEALKTLRAFGGLQAYPSRIKDPDGVDFSTGSVGLGVSLPTSPPSPSNISWITSAVARRGALSPWSEMGSWTRGIFGKP